MEGNEMGPWSIADSREGSSSDTRLSPVGIELLNDDLLLKIFTILSDCDLRPPKSGWHHFSQVSRRWRTLALHSPILWTQPDWSYGTAAAEEMIRRSQDASLIIRRTYRFKKHWLHTLSQAVAERHRVCRIDLFIDDSRVEATVKTLFHLMPSFHNLEDLDIHIRQRGQVQRQILIPLAEQSRLRSIQLYGCLFSQEHVMFPNLVLLSLSYVHSPLRLTATLLANLLSKAPNLEELSCVSVIRSTEHERAVQKPIFQHEKLRFVKLCEEFPICTQLFQAIQFPSLQQIEVDLADFDDQERVSERSLWQYLRSMYYTLSYSVVIVSCADVELTEVAVYWKDYNDPVDCSKSFLRGGPPQFFVNYIPLWGPHVRRLDLDDVSVSILNVEIWQQVFTQLPQLEIIFVSEDALGVLLQFLCSKLPKGGLAFGLNICSITVSTRYPISGPLEWRSGWTECLLERQAAIGHPLKELVLEKQSEEELVVPEEARKLTLHVVARYSE